LRFHRDRPDEEPLDVRETPGHDDSGPLRIMKNFLAILVVIAAAFALYYYHNQQVETAALEAAARARRDALNSIPRRTPEPAPPPIVHAVAVSRGLESLYNEVFADLNRQQPVDLVPPLQMTREHILDAKVRADPGMQSVYDLGEKVTASMVDVAEERTKALQSLLEATVRPQAALDGKNATTTTNGFFAQTATRRWDDERRRRKANVDALMAALRNAERNWNQRLPADAPADSYDAPPHQQVLITVEAAPRSNPLEREAYNQRRATYPWRTVYYDQYGYRHTY
jgi:hypothetical protein